MATRSLGSLTLDLIAKIGGYIAPIDKAKRKTKEATDDISGYWKNVGLAAASAGAAYVAGLAVLVKGSIDAADELSKTSQIVGVAVEDLSGLNHAADLSGVSLDELSASLNKLNKVNAQAYDGTGKGAKAYDALGISVKNADGTLKDNYQLMNEIADAFSKMEDGAQKSALAQDLLGKSGAKLIPLLNGGSKGIADFRAEAERLGLVIDEKTAKASEEFNDNLSRLQSVATGLGNKLARDIVPVLAEFTSTLADPDTQEGLVDFAQGIVKVAEYAVKAASGLGDMYRLINGFDVENLGHIDKQIEYVKSAISNPSERLRFFGKDGLIEYYSEDELKSELEKLMKQRDSILAKGNKPESSSAGSSGGSDRKSFLLDEEKLNKSLTAQIDEQISSQLELNKVYEEQYSIYNKQLNVTQNATELEKLRYELVYGSLKGINAEQAKRLEGMAQELDKATKLKENEQAVNELRKEFSSIQEDSLKASGNLVDLEDYRSKKQREALEKQMEELKEKGAWTAELEAESQKALEEQEQGHQDRIKKIREQAEQDELKRRQIALAGAESLFGALGDLTEAFGEKNSRLRKAFLIAEKASAIASATIAIQKGIAEASTLSFPANLVAMGTVAAQTAGILTTIKGVNIAHGGLDYVPKEQTYLLDRGERVVSPKQNTDLTNFLANAKASTGMRVEVINNATNVPMAANASIVDENTLRIVLTAVDARLKEDLNNGRGVWRQAEGRYGLAVKGAY